MFTNGFMKGYNKLIILSAPSGAGKTTIARHLLVAGLGLEFSVSACSRAKRPGEVNGRDYYFLTTDEFRKSIEAGCFVEWEEVYPGQFYGTLKSEIERIHHKGLSVLFDVDVKGALSLKRIYGEQALSVFIMPPSLEVLKERLEKRGTDSPEKVRIRLAKAEIEMLYVSKFDAVIVNDQLEPALSQAETLVRSFLNDKG